MRALVRIVVVLVAVVLAAAAILYGGSEWIVRRSHAVPLEQVSVPRDAASIAEGGRLAMLTGCRGCHGANGQGLVFDDVPAVVGTIAPPAIARKIADYSDPELERLIRHGVRKDGTTLFVMPTRSQRWLADDDVAKLIAWLRTLKPLPSDSLVATSFGPLGRWMILTGQANPSLHVGKVAQLHRPAEVGRYFYDSVCAECHALDRDQPTEDGKEVAPALAPMAASYTLPEFTRLLRTGAGKKKADLGLMTGVAKEGLHAFTDAEIAAIHAYLVGEAGKLQPQ